MTTLYMAIRGRPGVAPGRYPGRRGDLDDDLPPADYAAKTGEGLSGSRW